MIQKFLKSLFDQGYTQEEIEEISGISQSTISKAARGGNITVETLEQFADTFGVTTDHVLGRTWDKQTSIKIKH